MFTRLLFAGDRDISVDVLNFLIGEGVKPLALAVPEGGKSSHAEQLIALCPFLDSHSVLRGKQICEPDSVEFLKSLDLDYVISIHFPHILAQPVLLAPRIGVLNLHPAYLPFNRGFHTPTWAILEGTPFGATLHFMNETIDAGDVALQREMQIQPGDTADTAYQRVKKLELQIFKEAWPLIKGGILCRRPQDISTGTYHNKRDLFCSGVQRIDLDEDVKAGQLIDRLRAMTTNQIEESAYFESDGKRYRIQVVIQEDSISKRLIN